MKKIFVLISLVFILSTTRVHAQCVGGTEYVGSNDVHICVSKVVLNWFSAWAWCDANHMRLARWGDLCPDITKGSACPYFASLPEGNYEIADPKFNNTTQHAFVQRSSNTNLYYKDGTDTQNYRANTSAFIPAICVQK